MTSDPLPEDWATPQFDADELSVIAEALGEMAHLLDGALAQQSTVDKLRELRRKALSLAFMEMSHDA